MTSKTLAFNMIEADIAALEHRIVYLRTLRERLKSVSDESLCVFLDLRDYMNGKPEPAIIQDRG